MLYTGDAYHQIFGNMTPTLCCSGYRTQHARSTDKVAVVVYVMQQTCGGKWVTQYPLLIKNCATYRDIKIYQKKERNISRVLILDISGPVISTNIVGQRDFFHVDFLELSAQCLVKYPIFCM